MNGMESIFRWLHLFTGVMWIGLLYFFNFVNGPFATTMDAATKKVVVPELMPRALFWFRWMAAFTWVTGILLLGLVFHATGVHFSEEGRWNAASGIMTLLVFSAPFLYDAIYKAMGHTKASIAVGFALMVAVILLMDKWAQFSYRGVAIHFASMLGTIMAFNVWFRIWPSQRHIITNIKNGTAPDANIVALAGMRSKHNTYMSLPLMWGMLNVHSIYFAGGNLGLTPECAWIVYPAITLLSWHIIWHCYRRSAKVKGF